MDNFSIKDNICKFRKRKNMTQEEMAHLLGISVTAYRELEKGGTSVMNPHIMNMAKLTETPTEEIVLGYRPSQIENLEKLREKETEYSDRIETLERRISDLEKLVASLEETIASKNEIISMLKKNLGRVE
ncbi:MAG: helix-turn-helix domain-containing protein [Candidatus Cryptobacteroides sp.]